MSQLLAPPIGAAPAQSPPSSAPAALLQLAGVLAQQGLITLARRSLDRAVAELSYIASQPSPPASLLAEHALCERMAAAIALLPSDQPADLITRRELLRSNIQHLAPLPGVAAAAHTFLQQPDEWFVSRKSGLTRHTPPSPPTLGIGSLHTPMSAADAQRAAQSLIDPAQPYTRPFVVCGARSLDIALAAASLTERSHLGYTPRLWIVEEDLDAFCEGLFRAGDAAKTLFNSTRITFCLGKSALEYLAASLSERTAWTLPKRMITSWGATPEATHRCMAVLTACDDRQRCEIDAHSQALRQRYLDRTVDFWARRWATATSEAPLRWLIITSQYTTYVQHAARDLISAIERAGMHAHLLIEPDTHATPTSLAYLSVLSNFDPDCVVSINYPRQTLGPACPGGTGENGTVWGIPFICWIQDALSHLFDERVGRAQGPLDFVVGHVYQTLIDRFGYPAPQCISSPVVADAYKFCPLIPTPPVDCDVAHVSRQSAPPHHLHAQIVAQAHATAPQLANVFESLQPLVGNAVDACNSTALYQTLETATHRLLHAANLHVDERTVQNCLRGYALPMADRLLRHNTLHLVKLACDASGRTLRLFGPGWEEHPTLGECAAGSINHDTSLRDVYQRAHLHLHISANTLIHQRVIECALSGGLCAVRMHRDALGGLKAVYQLQLVACPPDVVEESQPSATFDPEGAWMPRVNQGRIGYRADRHPPAAALLALSARWGFPSEDGIAWMRTDRARSILGMRTLLEGRGELTDLFDPVEDLLFSCQSTFSTILDRACNNPQWRARAISHSRAAAINRFTHDALIGRVTAFVTQRLRDQASPTLTVENPS